MDSSDSAFQTASQSVQASVHDIQSVYFIMCVKTQFTRDLYSNAFRVKSGAQSLTFKSVTDKQPDKQTN